MPPIDPNTVCWCNEMGQAHCPVHMTVDDDEDDEPPLDWMYFCEPCGKGTNHFATYALHMFEAHGVDVAQEQSND